MIGLKIVIQFLGTGTIGILSLFILALTARFFGPSVLGEVNYLLGLLGIFLIFSDLGFSRAHIRFVSNKRQLQPKIGTFLAIKIVLYAVFLIAALAYFFIFRISEASSIYVFILLAFNEFFYRLSVSLLYTFEGMQMVTVENLVLGIGKAVKLVAVILLIFISRTALGLGSTYILEALAVTIGTWFFLKKYAPFKFDKSVFNRYIRYSLPFFIIYPLSYLQGNIDVIILKNFWNTTAVGYYSAALGLAAFVKSLNGVLITLFFPKMSQIYSSGKTEKVQEYTDAASKYLLMIFFPLMFFLYLFRTEFIGIILGSGFTPSINIFSVSLLGFLLLMLSSPYDQAIYASGKHKIMAPITLITLLISVVLQLFLVPTGVFGLPAAGWGALGTVTANTFVWGLSLIIQLTLAKRLLNINFYSKNILILVFGAFMLLIVFIIRIDNSIVLLKLPFFVIFAVLFYGFCTKSKILTNSDKKYFKIVFKPANILKAGLSEIYRKK